VGNPNEMDRLSASAATVPPALAYQPPAEREREPISWGPPMSWPLAIALFALWTIPILPWTFDIDSLYGRPLRQMMVFLLMGGADTALFALRTWRARRDAPIVSPDLDTQARRRVAVLIVAAAAVFVIQASALPVRLAFLLYRGDFERARTSALASMPPGSTAPHPRIGPFRIVAIARGPTGGVALKLASNSGFECGRDWLCVPPGDSGDLGGGWRWEATD
jgi:hypothetical protein